MSLFYITGVPGTGKTTIQKELIKRGYEAHDLDESGFGGPVDLVTGESTSVPLIEERNSEWFDQHEWRVSRKAIEDLKKQSKNKVVYLCGTASTEHLVWDLFDKVLYLNIDEATLRSRILSRNNGNDFGKSDDELQIILGRYNTAQANLGSLAVTFVDASKPLNEVVTTVIQATTQ